MSKTIKLVALVGDEEVSVGRCHPGQARILRKNGFAEWKKDHLLLVGGTPPVLKAKLSPEDIEEFKKQWEAAQADPSGFVLVTEGWSNGGIYQRGFEVSHSWKEEVEDIDPEGLLLVQENSWFPGQGYRTEAFRNPDEILSASLKEWVTEAKNRVAAGHTLLLADDAKRRLLGFVDDEDDKVFYLPLIRIKSAPDKEWESIRVLRENFATREGRMEVLGITPESEEPLDPSLSAELEEIWTAEAERIGDAMRAKEGVRLADEWGIVRDHD